MFNCSLNPIDRLSHAWNQRTLNLFPPGRRQPPEALLPPARRGAGADGALAVPPETGDGVGDLREEHVLQAGQQRPRRPGQAHLRAHVRLDRGARQHGAAHHVQAALLYRRAGHLRVTPLLCDVQHGDQIIRAVRLITFWSRRVWCSPMVSMNGRWRCLEERGMLILIMYFDNRRFYPLRRAIQWVYVLCHGGSDWESKSRLWFVTYGITEPTVNVLARSIIRRQTGESNTSPRWQAVRANLLRSRKPLNGDFCSLSKVWDIWDQQLWAVLHQLRQREAAAAVQLGEPSCHQPRNSQVHLTVHNVLMHYCIYNSIALMSI